MPNKAKYDSVRQENIMNPLTADQVTLGFIGVGAMGSRIVRRLRRSREVDMLEFLGEI